MKALCRSAHSYLRLRRIGLRTTLLLLIVIALFASPMAVFAQGPSSFWIPPYDPQQIPAGAEGESATVATSHGPLPLIIDTDPGVDDAVALGWLLTVLDPDDILGIVTVAGNTTVENATANVNTVLGLVGNPDVEVVTGAKKPLSQQLSSTNKLIHGLDGLWGAQLVQTAKSPKKEARNFYCSNAAHSPSATILALGPLTNIAEAIRHCREAMTSYERIVILGGAKFGGNTTPVSEFNFWQDPEAAQIVFQSGMNIDLVPLDAFTQFGFTSLELVGDPTTIPPTPSVFEAATQPVFQHLADPVKGFSYSQILAGVQMLSIPDLAAAIYTIDGTLALADPPPPTLALAPALIEIVDRPDSVRGQSIIGLGFMERVTMVTSDKQLDNLANQALAVSDSPVFPGVLDRITHLFGQILPILANYPDNAKVVMDFDEVAMRTLFLDLLSSAGVTVETQGEETNQSIPSGTIYLPSVSAD